MIPVGKKPETVPEVVELLHGTLAALDEHLLKDLGIIRQVSCVPAETLASDWRAKRGIVRDILKALS